MRTYTFVVLEVSEAAYKEIADALRKAGYDHVFTRESVPNGKEVIDMNGLALGMVQSEDKR